MSFNLEKPHRRSEWGEDWNEIQPTPLCDLMRAQFRLSAEEGANLGNRRMLTGGDSDELEETRAMRGDNYSFRGRVSLSFERICIPF